MERKLTAKQRLFCDEYIKSGNAKGAALKAGYSAKTAYSIGNENLNKPELKSYIDAKMAEFNQTKSEFRKKENDSTIINFYTKVIFPSNEVKEEVYRKASIPANEEYITWDQLKRYFNR